MLESPPSASGIAKDEGQQTSKEHQVCIPQGVLPQITLLYNSQSKHILRWCDEIHGKEEV